MTAMPDSNITNDSDDFDDFANWSTPEPSERLDDFLTEEPIKVSTESLNDDRTPDGGFLEPPARSKKARDYEKKLRSPMRTAIKVAVQNPATVPDAATLIMYGPDFCEAAGNLAAESAITAKVIDFLTDTTENAGLAMVAATAPLVLQLLRNHEPQAEVTHRQIRIPFTKRALRLRINLRLPGKMRAVTEEPQLFATRVLTDDAVQAVLRKQGIRIVRA